jgi:hypothetical protein
MPISNQEITDYEMNIILSSTKEDLDKLTEIELRTISDILSKRKDNRYIQPRTQSLLEIVHYLIGQDSDRERKQTELKKKQKENSQKFPNVVFSLLKNWNFIMGNPGYYTAGKHYSKEEFNESNRRGLEELKIKRTT